MSWIYVFSSFCTKLLFYKGEERLNVHTYLVFSILLLMIFQYTVLSHWLSFGPSEACLETPHLRGYINSSFNILCSEESKCQTFVQVFFYFKNLRKFYGAIVFFKSKKFLILKSFEYCNKSFFRYNMSYYFYEIEL